MELGRDSDTGGQVNEICQVLYMQQDKEERRKKEHASCLRLP